MEVLAIILYAVIAVNGTADNNIENLLNESMILINNSQYDEALIQIDKILLIDENNLQALSNKGGILIKLEKYENAIEYFDKALKIKPDFVEALNNKGIALYNLGKYGDAALSFYKSSEIDPENKVSKDNAKKVIERIPYVWEKGYVQIEVRDEENNLVGYTEVNEFIIKNPLANIVLEKNGWKRYEINGMTIQKLENIWELDFHETGLYAKTDIMLDVGNIKYDVIQILHDGFLVEDGDHVKIVLELFKTSWLQTK